MKYPERLGMPESDKRTIMTDDGRSGGMGG
jgi:hypothetical protein